MRLHPFIAATAGLCLVGTAAAQTSIGPGVGITPETVDTPGSGPRTNIDETNFVTLDPGTYQATNFSFNAGQSGDVTPLLLTSSANNTFDIIAVGASVPVAGAGTQTVPFGGLSTFTLSAPTVVYAGITNSDAATQNPVFTDLGVGQTAHDNAGMDPDRFTVGGQLEAAGFSHPDLNRVYAFSVDVELIPEPASLGLLAVGALGLLGRRRRN